MKKNPWVQCPQINSVQEMLSNLKIVNYRRGSGEATQRLDYLESSYRKWIKDIIDLTDFQYCYFVNGVTDALNQWVATETRTWQYLQGDYEYAKIIGGDGHSVSEINPEQLLYISNPACETGNFISLDCIDNPVILDCAYLGSTDIQKIIPPKNTEQIWFSFSKGWGLVGQRCGLVFTKEPHRSLHPMKKVEGWNYTGVETAIAVVENYDINTIYDQYKDLQEEVCKELDLIPSDCFFIATSTDPEYSVRRRSSNIARLDLSKILEDK